MQIGITAEEADKRLAEKAALSKDAGTVTHDDSKDTEKKDGDEGGDKDEDETIPFHKHPRFQEMARQNREFKAKMAEIDREKAEKTKEAKKEFKLDPNMPFDEAIQQIKQDAVAEALEAFRAEQSKENSKISAAEALINDGFDYLRDSGIKISQKDEDAIAEIAVQKKIRIETPEDMQIAYDIFDLARKTAGAGKSKETTTIANDRKDEKKEAINYSQTSWSNIGSKIGEKLGINGNS